MESKVVEINQETQIQIDHNYRIAIQGFNGMTLQKDIAEKVENAILNLAKDNNLVTFANEIENTISNANIGEENSSFIKTIMDALSSFVDGSVDNEITTATTEPESDRVSTPEIMQEAPAVETEAGNPEPMMQAPPIAEPTIEPMMQAPPVAEPTIEPAPTIEKPVVETPEPMMQAPTTESTIEPAPTPEEPVVETEAEIPAPMMQEVPTAEPTIEPAPALEEPVVETEAETPAPMMQEVPIAEPTIEPASALEEPVVETEAETPAPMMQEVPIAEPTIEPAPALEEPVVETEAETPAPMMQEVPIAEPTIEPAPALEEPVVETEAEIPAPMMQEVPTAEPTIEPTPALEEPVVETEAETPAPMMQEVPIAEPTIEPAPALEEPVVETEAEIPAPMMQEVPTAEPTIEPTPALEEPVVETEAETPAPMMQAPTAEPTIEPTPTPEEPVVETEAEIPAPMMQEAPIAEPTIEPTPALEEPVVETQTTDYNNQNINDIIPEYLFDELDESIKSTVSEICKLPIANNIMLQISGAVNQLHKSGNVENFVAILQLVAIKHKNDIEKETFEQLESKIQILSSPYEEKTSMLQSLGARSETFNNIQIAVQRKDFELIAQIVCSVEEEKDRQEIMNILKTEMGENDFNTVQKLITKIANNTQQSDFNSKPHSLTKHFLTKIKSLFKRIRTKFIDTNTNNDDYNIDSK